MIKTIFVALLFCCIAKGYDLKILKATSQEWRGGIKNSKNGIEYKFEFVVNKSSNKISIDSLTLSGKKTDYNIYKKNDIHPLKNFSKNDTLIISAKSYSGTKVEKADIYYKTGKKQRLFTIENIQSLPVLNYP
jgi:hypothetical protein